MESLCWSIDQQYHPLEDNSLFMSGSGNIGGNIISKDHHLNHNTKAVDHQHVQKNDTFINGGTTMLHHPSFDHNSYCPQNGPILDSQSPSVYDAGLKHLKSVIATTNTASFGSLDCLLSASNNSQTDTTASIEDDGISMIFSNCKSYLLSSNHYKTQGKSFVEASSRNSSQEHIFSNVSHESRSGNHSHDDDTNPNKRKRDHQENLQTKSSALTSHQNRNSLSHKSNPSTTSHVTSNNNSFQLISSPSYHHHRQNHKKPKNKPKSSEKAPFIAPSSSNINFQQTGSSASSGSDEPDTEAIAQMKEMIYRAAAFRPVDFSVETTEKPKRKNVKISNDPQTVAARQRRERISERIRVLQRLVPGGNKMDTASMLDEAANYLKFLRSWVKALESLGHKIDHHSMINSFSSAYLNNLGFSVPFVDQAFAMQHQQMNQPQFSILNPSSSVHPSRS